MSKKLPLLGLITVGAMTLPPDGLQKTSVTLKMLINSGILNAGQEIFCINPDIKGILKSDGSITVKIDGKEKSFEYLSGAARHIEKRSLNGWIYWYIIIDGEKRSIGSFRDQYLQKMHKSEAK